MVYKSGFSRVTELMGSLYTVKGFVDDLQSAVQLPTMVSSCEWKSKDLAVAQSRKSRAVRPNLVLLALYSVEVPLK